MKHMEMENTKGTSFKKNPYKNIKKRKHKYT